MFADNYSYREYQRLLVELHGLIANGRNQTPEAHEIRHRMEVAEARLSEPEIVRLNGLSADLSMLHDREIPDPDVASRIPADEIPGLIESAYQQKNWGDLLELLRTGVSHLWQPDQIAYVRSRAYEGLGELSPAVAFMDEAAKRRPNNSNYRALALRLLWESSRFEDAYARARDYLNDSSTNARLVIMSGGIVAQRSMHAPEPSDLNRIAAAAVLRMQQVLPSETSPALIFAGNVSLGLLALQIDEIGAAALALNEALHVDSTSDQQVSSTWALSRELELVRGGKAKSPEERLNAKRLVEFARLSQMALAA